MPGTLRTGADMIANMTPELKPGSYVFVTINDPARIASLTAEAIGTFQEDEGMSLILPLEVARKSVLNTDQPMRCVTLNVYSDLDGVGLTAAVATALGEADIPCNMVAAYHHDHVFVPAAMAERALTVLVELQRRSSAVMGGNGL
jgi:hypothetical protein